MKNNHCEACDTDFIPTKGHPEQLYCSERCRIVARNAYYENGRLVIPRKNNQFSPYGIIETISSSPQTL